MGRDSRADSWRRSGKKKKNLSLLLFAGAHSSDGFLRCLELGHQLPIVLFHVLLVNVEVTSQLRRLKGLVDDVIKHGQLAERIK